jgi:hypothetical protein
MAVISDISKRHTQDIIVSPEYNYQIPEGVPFFIDIENLYENFGMSLDNRFSNAFVFIKSVYGQCGMCALSDVCNWAGALKIPACTRSDRLDKSLGHFITIQEYRKLEESKKDFANGFIELEETKKIF